MAEIEVTRGDVIAYDALGGGLNATASDQDSPILLSFEAVAGTDMSAALQVGVVISFNVAAATDFEIGLDVDYTAGPPTPVIIAPLEDEVMSGNYLVQWMAG
jgi:hypothetical protein